MATPGMQTITEVQSLGHAPLTLVHDIPRRDASPSLSSESKQNDSDVSKTIELDTLEKLPGRVSSHDLHELNHGDNDGITREMRITARIHFAACCYCLFLAGWNDGATGPLLPRMQENYGIDYTIVSLLFIMNCIGFVAGAASNIYLMDRFGFGKVLVIGSIAQTVAYTIQSPAPPFPVFCLGYAINGFGIALQDAQANGYVASLKSNASTKMGVLHAVYGLGAFTSPIVATQFSQATHWSFQYIVSACIAFTNTLVLIAVFRGRTQDACLQAIGQSDAEVSTSTDSKYRQILRQKIVHLLAIWALLYVGVEVTIGGWTVTYIIQQRNGKPSAGYISSGFFGGLTLGRVALLWVNAKVGERLVVVIYALISIGLEIVIWLVPSLVGDAVAVAIVGFFLGPMYPILMNQSATLIPPFLLTGSIGWIAGFGQAGSAMLPFITGALAQGFGISSLQPFLVTLMAIMAVTWALILRVGRRAR